MKHDDLYEFSLQQGDDLDNNVHTVYSWTVLFAWILWRPDVVLWLRQFRDM